MHWLYGALKFLMAVLIIHILCMLIELPEPCSHARILAAPWGWWWGIAAEACYLIDNNPWTYLTHTHSTSAAKLWQKSECKPQISAVEVLVNTCWTCKSNTCEHTPEL